MPGGKPLRLGPFIGGLNTASDVTAIADAELSKLSNFELDIDGSLISRPPIQELAGHVSWTERIVCIGEAVFGGVHYLIGSNANGVFHYQTGAWTLITTTIKASVAVQYADKLYLVAVPGSVNPGGKWDPVGGFVAVATIPNGSAAVVHKERLFIVPGVAGSINASRISFSDPSNFEVWPATNFIDVGQGDGTTLNDVTVFQDNLLLFKDESTFVLAYDVRPSDAVLREISATIGVRAQHCLINYENQIYIIHNGWVYEIINYDFNRLNTKVPFIRDETAPTPFAAESVSLSIIEDRLLCRYYAKTYVYGLRTRTWSEWTSVADVLKYFGPVFTLHPPGGNEYYAGSALSGNRTMLKFIDQRTAINREQTIDPARNIVDTFSRAVADGWGTTDTGENWTVSGGVASNFSVNGSKGLVRLTAVGDLKFCGLNSLSIQDVDIVGSISPDKVATGAGAWITGSIRARKQGTNYYFARVEFKDTGIVGMGVYKAIAGVPTLLAGAEIASYTANSVWNWRFQINGTAVRGKLWRVTDPEPTAWLVSGTDAVITGPGSVELASELRTGSTAVPVVLGWDDIKIGNMADVLRTITCAVKTKNFDMAIPHQFKRLWWWGADVSSNNSIKGIATPVIVSFNVTWAALAAYKWNQLKTWAQPLSEPSSVDTVTTTNTGTARRFAKFLKSLRYRQINFEVQLTTDGSTVDGPARLFTMTILTESKQVVSKGVS